MPGPRGRCPPDRRSPGGAFGGSAFRCWRAATLGVRQWMAVGTEPLLRGADRSSPRSGRPRQGRQAIFRGGHANPVAARRVHRFRAGPPWAQGSCRRGAEGQFPARGEAIPGRRGPGTRAPLCHAPPVPLPSLAAPPGLGCTGAGRFRPCSLSVPRRGGGRVSCPRAWRGPPGSGCGLSICDRRARRPCHRHSRAPRPRSRRASGRRREAAPPAPAARPAAGR